MSKIFDLKLNVLFAGKRYINHLKYFLLKNGDYRLYKITPQTPKETWKTESGEKVTMILNGIFKKPQ